VFQVPEHQKRFVRRLAVMPSEELQALEGALSDIGPRAYVPQLVRELADVGPLDLPESSGVMSVVGSLHVTRESLGQDIEDMVRLVVETAVQDELATTEAERHNLEAALSSLLRSTVLRQTMKAGDLMIEVDRPYVRGRVLTDFRPIFDEDGGFSVGLIARTLRVSTVGSDKPVSFALDEADIDDLEAQLVRARDKANTIRAKLQASGIDCVSPKDVP